VVQVHWRVIEMNHAWPGGSVFGSFTDLQGPGATEAMWQFFARHPDRLLDQTVAAREARAADASPIPD
jgi:hypothetical protein